MFVILAKPESPYWPGAPSIAAGCPIFATGSSSLRWGRAPRPLAVILAQPPAPSFPTSRHSGAAPTSRHSPRRHSGAAPMRVVILAQPESPYWPLPLPLPLPLLACHSERSEESPHWPLPLPVPRRCLFSAVILSSLTRQVELRPKMTPQASTDSIGLIRRAIRSTSFEREGSRRTPYHLNPPPLSPTKSPPSLFLTPYPLPLFSCQDSRTPNFPLTNTKQTT